MEAMVIRRQPRATVGSLPAVLAVIERLKPATLVVDIEPLVARWGAPDSAFSVGASDLIRTAGDLPSVGSIVFTSNSTRDRPGLMLVSHVCVSVVPNARKPWRAAYLRNAATPVVVVGDQILTDGLMAWRLQSPFLHYNVGGGPPWPRLQAIVGNLLAPILFRSLSVDGGGSGPGDADG